jgi:hypothetical protein
MTWPANQAGWEHPRKHALGGWPGRRRVVLAGSPCDGGVGKGQCVGDRGPRAKGGDEASPSPRIGATRPPASDFGRFGCGLPLCYRREGYWNF